MCVFVCVLWRLKFTQHIIDHFKVYNTVPFHSFTILCSHHLYLVPRHFITPKRNFLPIINHFPFPHFSTPWKLTICFLYLDLPILDFFIQKETYLSCFESLCCSICYYFITFCQIIFYCMGIAHFVFCPFYMNPEQLQLYQVFSTPSGFSLAHP